MLRDAFYTFLSSDKQTLLDSFGLPGCCVCVGRGRGREREMARKEGEKMIAM